MVIIIGGGITGLSLAYLLSHKGFPVTVVEKETELGGNCSWAKLGNFTVDRYYHVITNTDSAFLNWAVNLGIGDKIFPIKTKMGFYQEGKIFSISTPADFLKFPPLSFLQCMRLGVSIIRSRMVKDWHSLEGVTAKHWLSSLAGEDIYKKLWDPVIRNKFGPLTDELVATDMWFRINRISSMQHKKFKDNAYYLKGSLKTFFDALEKYLLDKGVKIIKGCAVSSLKANGSCISAVVLNNRQEISADKIISAIPLPEFARILPSGYEDYSQRLRKVRYLNNVSLILRLKHKFSPYYQLNIGEDGFPFTGIIGADAQYPPRDFQGSFLLYVSKYFTGEDNILNKNAGELLDDYMPYLKKIRPEFETSWVLDKTVTRGRNVETIHSLNYSQLIPSFTTPIPNLYLLCTAQIYPEATVLDESFKYAGRLVNRFFDTNE